MRYLQDMGCLQDSAQELLPSSLVGLGCLFEPHEVDNGESVSVSQSNNRCPHLRVKPVIEASPEPPNANNHWFCVQDSLLLKLLHCLANVVNVQHPISSTW